MQTAAQIATVKQAAEPARAHWAEYCMEAAELGLFMVSACVVTTALEYPGSSLRQALPNAIVRRVVAGIAMGLTAIAIFCSPWGKRSGAHMNPAFTLTFYMLGKIHPRDAAAYVAAQFAGGAAGVLLTRWILGAPVGHAAVNYAVTVPLAGRIGAAFWGEALISGLLVTMVLLVSNTKRLTRFTPFLAGAMIALYIAIEAPLSGMSMNPARTVASALPANVWTALWIYFTAPTLGMLSAALLYTHFRGAHRVFCAKLHHHNSQSCIFRCNYGAM